MGADEPRLTFRDRPRSSGSKLSKVRLDLLLINRGLADSRQKAQALILAGQVRVDERKVEKSGALVKADASLRIIGEALPYVSRAGLKLEAALDHFSVEVAGKTCLDIGASTGGFTDCLLQRGAARVLAVDVGTNQLHWKLRTDPRVVSIEQTNARYLNPSSIAQAVDLVTMDVSFISATLILPVVPALLNQQAEILVLAKPQFEVRRGQVGKGGVVRDDHLRQDAVARVAGRLQELGFQGIESAESVLPGVCGNHEYFVHAAWRDLRAPAGEVRPGF
ncbi:MAG TPA: TlyA family RNA methyltransferase [Terriglobia bacterium]|nr:TlyA family RNA methyltransferase [Terriglobia bacterium]